jgi:hypothetical protein
MARPRLAQLRGARAAVADRGQACLRCGTAQPTALLSSRTQSMNIAVSMVILGREAGFIPALISFTHCFTIPSPHPANSQLFSLFQPSALPTPLLPNTVDEHCSLNGYIRSGSGIHPRSDQLYSLFQHPLPAPPGPLKSRAANSQLYSLFQPPLRRPPAFASTDQRNLRFSHCFSIPSANPRPSHRQSRENSALLIVSVFPSADPRPSHPQISEISAFLIVSVFPSADPRPLHQQSREFSAFLIVSASPPPSPRPSHPQINEISLFPQCFSLPSIP